MAAGEVVTLAAPAGEQDPDQDAPRFAIVFEDEHVLVVDKPAGLVTHPAPGHHGPTLAQALRGLAAVHYVRNRGDDRRQALEFDAQAAALGAEIGMPQLTRGAWPPVGPLDLGGQYGPKLERASGPR